MLDHNAQKSRHFRASTPSSRLCCRLQPPMTTRDEALAAFVAVTGADQHVAQAMLDGHDWDVQRAITFYFATSDASEGGGALDAGAASGSAADGRDAASSASMMADGDDVRQPIPTKRQRLTEDFSPLPALQSRFNSAVEVVKASAAMDALRDFGAETRRRIRSQGGWAHLWAIGSACAASQGSLALLSRARVAKVTRAARGAGRAVPASHRFAISWCV